jgi:DNA helicase-2/ATP-dependent DNA helicase PcrA
VAFEPTGEQLAILRHDLSRHARILAGPGTGKSATVIALLNIKAAILGAGGAKLLTFTRAATAELTQKLDENPNIACERPSTLHSFCISVLLRNPGLGDFPRPLRMADDWESDKIVEKTLSRRLKIPKLNIRTLFRELAANWESLVPEEGPKVTPAERARFLGAWREHREIFGYTLPSELPYALRIALRDHNNIEGTEYALLVVDEYQDLNSCDLDVLHRLSERGCHIIGAGDDDQSIYYSLRKAHPAGIRRFLEDYAGASDYPLSITLRCGSKIVEWANFVIQGDPDRPSGRAALRASPSAPNGEVKLLSLRSEIAEADEVAKIASYLINEKKVLAPEILILSRSDHHGQFSKSIKEALTKRKIAFSDPSTVSELMERPDTRHAMTRLRLLLNREDSLAWATQLYLTKGAGNAFVDYICEHAREHRTTFGHKLLELYATSFAGGPQGSAPRATRMVYEMLAWLETVDVPANEPEAGWASWIVQALQPSASPISTELQELLVVVGEKIEQTGSLDRYLSQIWPLAKDIALAKSNGVRIMTLGASKGLTVDAAIIFGLENGIVPMDGRELGEERRLLYVGMTRARKFVFGTWARQRRGPTARAGREHVGRPRQLSHFLEGGPVTSRTIK